MTTNQRILALAVALGALTLPLTGCGIFETEEPTPTPSITKTGSPLGAEDNPYPLGEVIAGNGWEVTVNSLNTDGTAAVAQTNAFNPVPEDGQKYVLANVTITRTGAEAAHPFDVELGLLTESGITLRPAAAQAPERIDLLAEMQPDATLTGNVAFLTGAEDEEFLVSVTAGSREDRAYVQGR